MHQEDFPSIPSDVLGGGTLPHFTFPRAISHAEQKIISNVRTGGLHIVAIREEDDMPQFFYTIGLYSQYQHPELLLMGLNVNVAYDILSRAHQLIKSGGFIAPWMTLKTLSSITLKTVPIDASNYSRFLGYGMWFYRSQGGSRPDTFPAIELVWPDLLGGAFPWEEGYDTGFFDAQKLLCGDQALRQALKSNAWGATGTCAQVE
jgi:hypothetical protein